MKRLKWAAPLLVFSLYFSSCKIFNNTTKSKKPNPTGIDGVVKDSANKATKKDSLAAKPPKPYKEVITGKAITDPGLFKVHKVDEKYFFEIPDSLLDKEILIVTRISKAAAGGRAYNGTMGYSGDQINENVIQFSKAPNDKLFIRRVSYLERSVDSTENGLYRSVRNSNILPAVASFDIKAFSPDSSGLVIDMTEYISGDNDVLFFASFWKMSIFKLGALQSDKSYTQSIKSFVSNVEIRTTKTYAIAETSGFATYELNSSMLLLPTIPMQPRHADERVGYFSRGYTDFDMPQGVKVTNMITRWRLEPRPEDVQKYKSGELVEPLKPIIFYIDPATPKKWVPFLIQGVNDWQRAFEKAGFKNAIYALEAPIDDSTWSLEDAKHSAIVYKPSAVANASGPHVHDPRTGEILETHINWYHNIMQLLHKWYMVQAGPNDPRARKMEFDDSLMGQLIRFVASHEVGHTLGLRHNFGASSTIPVEKLRDKKWVEENGFCPSIMDYARFNYVAQPEDCISAKGLMPRIGVYDEWAIEWGYKWLPELKTEDQEKTYMNKWIIERLSKDKRIWFGDEMNHFDPRRLSEAVGDDPIKASYYGIQNLKRILPQLVQWTKKPDEDYFNLAQIRKEVFGQFRRYLFHVATNVGGRMYTPKTVEQKGKLVEFINRKNQKASIKFLHEQIFDTPTWLMDKRIFDLIGGGGFWEPLILQRDVLERVTSAAIFHNLLFAQLNSGTDSRNVYTIDELLTDLEAGIWKELNTKSPVNSYRRALQKMYADRLVGIMQFRVQQMYDMDTYWNTFTDASTIITVHIRRLIQNINLALPGYPDEVTKQHLIDVRDRLKKELNPLTSGSATAAAAKFGLNGEELDRKNEEDLRKSCWDHVDEFKFPITE